VKTLLVAAVASSLTLLAACGDDGDPGASASPSATASGSPAESASPSASKVSVKPSTNLNAIKVTGAYGKQPKVAVKAPWAIDKTRTKVLSEGDGPAIAEGATVTLNYAGINARTGKTFDDSFSRGEPATFSLAQVVPGFAKGLTGQRQGSRVLIAMPGADGYDAGGGNPQIEVQVGDTLLFVVDVVAAPLAGPEGEKVEPSAGLPTVTDSAGVPEVTMPKTDPPTKLTVQPLIKGKGAEVTESDTITFDYRWYTWDGRMLLIVPPADGYPEGNATPKIEKGTTLVLVVDLLFAAPTQ
jgi:peptidylprolyl isomerase